MLQTTDGRAIAYSERECEFTFGKNECFILIHIGHAVANIKVDVSCVI